MSPGRRQKYTASDDPVDRISSLPRPIIHGILSLLPAKDATRTSILSKNFYSCWASLPVIDLDFDDVTRTTNWSSSKGLEFMDYVSRMLRRRRLETDLVKFHLRFPMGKPYKEELDIVDDAVNYILFANSITDFSIANRVKELSIDLSSHTNGHRPPITIGDASFSFITKLNLVGVKLPNFSDRVLEWSGLVSLRLWHCSGLQAFKFSSSKIRSIDLGPCSRLNNVVIESPSLEKFKCCGIGFGEEQVINISKCPNLKKLTLSSVRINDDWVSYNIPTFSRLEKLDLDNCCLKNPVIWNDNLRKVKIGTGERPESTTEIRAKNLQSLSLTLHGPRKMRIGSCTHLRKLRVNVYDSYNTDIISAEEFLNEFLEEQVAKMNYLESLKLFVKSGIQRLEIRHMQLKRLELDLTCCGCCLSDELGKVVVDTPNLVSFSYSGYFIHIQLLDSKPLVDTELIIDERGEQNDDDFFKLWELIRCLSHSRNLTLTCSAEKYLLFPKELREKLSVQQPQNRDHLRVWFDAPYKISTDLMDSLLGLWPTLKTLCFVEYAPGHESSIKFQYETTFKEEDPQRPWQHSLRTVELNNFDAVDRENLTNYFKEHAKFLDAVLYK